MYLDEAKARLAQANARMPLADRVAPCSEREVAALEERFGMPLPAAYREFLLWMGHGADHLFRGTQCFYDILPLNDLAWGLLHEDKVAAPIPDDAFVFLMHQGYQFLFFRVTESPNPPVYSFGEGEYYRERAKAAGVVFPQTSASFNDFLLAEIEGHEQTLANSERRRGLAELARLSQEFEEND